MSVTGSIMAGVGLAGSIGGAAIGAHSADKAADAQSAAANHAADLQYKASQDALAFQKQQYAQGQSNLAPWLQSGAGGLANLDYLLGITPSSTQGQMAGGPITPYAPGGGLGGAQPTLPGGGMPQPGPIGVHPRPMLSSGSSTNFTGHVAPVGSNGFGALGSNPSLPPGQTGTPHPVGPQPGMPSPLGGGFGSPQLPGAAGHPVPVAQPGAFSTGPNMPAGGSQPAAGATGSNNLGSAVNPTLGGFGSLMHGYGQTFHAPTAAEAAQTPGYQFAQQQGQDALQRSAAARGGVLTGGTAKALDQYSQGLADSNYQNVYNNAMNTFDSNYNQFNNDQTNQYNRLAALAGIGQQTAGQLGYLGQNAAQGISSNLLGTASQMGQDYQNAGAASASGYVGAGNAWAGGLGGASNSIQNLLLMQQLQNMGGGGGALTIGGNGSITNAGY